MTHYFKSPRSIHECFTFDENELNPVPKRLVLKLLRLVLLSSSRYSMPVYMRLTQYFFIKAQESGTAIKKSCYLLIASFLSRRNEILNQFEHPANPNIAPGVVFHHPGVCITSKSRIESGVHFYRNVTLGEKNGKAPCIKKNAKIASHSIVIGNVTVGEKAIVAPGSVVTRDIPDKKVAAGVPAVVIGDTTTENYKF